MGIGRREGFALALGVSNGTCCWAVLTVFGFTSVIVRYAELLFVLKILGGCYLLWLGYKSLRPATSSREVDTTELRLAGGMLSLLGHSAYAFAFSTQTMVRMYTRCRRVIEGVLGVFFVMMGVRLISEK